MSAPLAVGMRVKWSTYGGFTSTEHRGTVTKVTSGGGCTVQLDNGGEVSFRSNARTKPGPLSERDLAIEAWVRECPRSSTKIVATYRPMLVRDLTDYRPDVEWPRDRGATPDEIEVVADYLKEVAAWLRRREELPE